MEFLSNKPLLITDTILRDAHQSQAATRMTIEDMMPALEVLDSIGYYSLECWGGATFDSCMRFLNEDPWERLRKLKAGLPKTKLQMLFRGQNILGYKHYADDVVDAFCRKSIENGIDIIRIFDALNDVRNLEQAIKSTKKYGGQVEATLSYTISPIHNEAYFVKLAKELEQMGADTICVKDMANLLLPMDAYSLIKALKESVSVPIHLHTHNTSGTGDMTYLMAAYAGVDIVDTALSPLANGTAQPATESLVATLGGTVRDTGLDLNKMSEAAVHFRKIAQRLKESGSLDPKVLNVDTNTLLYQVPGGMLSNLISQLKQAGKEDKYYDVLAEIPRVRQDFGYPPLVTPSSQIVGTQAVMNIIMGERYKVFPKESKAMLKGEYGSLPGEVNEEVRAKAGIAPEDVITEKIRELYATQRAYAAARELVANTEVEEENDLSNDESVPIIRFVNNMIEHAVNMKASDIHIEPHEDKLRIRFRIDGKMIVYMDTEAELGPSVSSRIKFISGLNIAERRIPQDGRINYNYGKDQTVDMRISILPGAFGETIVIRITTALEFKLDKHSIGFNFHNLDLFDRILQNTHGLVLLTGPTGSSKTTTLYAALSEIDKPDINIITVEDPVEMIMENMTQVEVNAKTGLTFATVMRSILRQDPDVVMVGEIRDEETAKIAMTLSITGHLVFSTLHTFDSPSAVLRLVDMGVEPYMVYSALSAVISQRLVRKLCPHCRRQYEADADEKRLLGVDPLEELYLYKSRGCDECNHTGYRGRTAVHEILMMSPAIRDDLAKGGSTESVGRIAKEEGMHTLQDNLRELVLMGITSVEEMRRTYSEYV